MSAAPVRFQRVRHIKGWNMQATSRAINGLPGRYVGRGTRFGNQYRVVEIAPWGYYVYNELTEYQFGPVSKAEAHKNAVEMFEEQQLPGMDVAELRGFNLCCFCGDDEPCHADALLKKANGQVTA